MPVLIGIGAVSHVSALEARNNALVLTPHSLLGCTTPPRAELRQQQGRWMTTTPGTSGSDLRGCSRLDWKPLAHT